MRHKYYVIAYVPCPECGGSHMVHRRDSDGEWEDECTFCNQQGEVLVQVLLTEAMEELGVTGFWKGGN